MPRQGVFTLVTRDVTRGRFLTSASKFNVEPIGGILDVRTKMHHASPNVKTASCVVGLVFT